MSRVQVTEQAFPALAGQRGHAAYAPAPPATQRPAEQDGWSPGEPQEAHAPPQAPRAAAPPALASALDHPSSAHGGYLQGSGAGGGFGGEAAAASATPTAAT